MDVFSGKNFKSSRELTHSFSFFFRKIFVPVIREVSLAVLRVKYSVETKPLGLFPAIHRSRWTLTF